MTMETPVMARSLERAHPVADWMTHERRNWIAGLVVAALGAYALGNGHTTSDAVQNVSWQLGEKKAQLHKLQTVDIPKLKAAKNCEADRGDKAAAVANDAIKGALSVSAPIPSPSDIPPDNCPHPK